METKAQVMVLGQGAREDPFKGRKQTQGNTFRS